MPQGLVHDGWHLPSGTHCQNISAWGAGTRSRRMRSAGTMKRLLKKLESDESVSHGGGILLIFCCFYFFLKSFAYRLPGIESQVTEIINTPVVLHSVIRPRVDDFRVLLIPNDILKWPTLGPIWRSIRSTMTQCPNNALRTSGERLTIGQQYISRPPPRRQLVCSFYRLSPSAFEFSRPPSPLF